MTLGRREFLQRLSVALAALGISDFALLGSSRTYQRAFANTSRCLALLIGINAYGPGVWQQGAVSEKGAPLQGAVMDGELQRELLIHRFGVVPGDIVTLFDAQATGARILQAIQEHLVNQAQPGDTVVLHFSGLGSQVQLAGHTTGEYLPTWVAVDSQLPQGQVPALQDVFEENIAQLLSDLRGVNVLTVIDASTTPHPSMQQGNFRVRSRPVAPAGIWQAAANVRLQEPRQSSAQLSQTWPGLLLRASAPGQPALEGAWGDFSAGLFTYALTQQLWSSLPAQRQYWLFHRLERTLTRWTGTPTAPQVQGQEAAKAGLPLLAGRLPQPAADGVVQTLDPVGKSATLWLGGLPPALLPYGELGLRLQPLPALPGLAAIPPGTLVVKNLEGLRAKAELRDADTLPVGVPLLEIERRLPKEISLVVALDPALERIERVDATSALAGLSFITTTGAGEQPADCLFGKGPGGASAIALGGTAVTPGEGGATTVTGAAAASQGYGLFTPDHTLMAGTVAAEEAVKTAVGRLQAPLRHLLAVKLLRLTTNPMSSQLPLRLTLATLEPAHKVLLVEETLRSYQLTDATIAQRDRAAAGNLGKQGSQPCQIRLLNSGQQPLYYLLVSVTDNSRLSVYCPPWDPAIGLDQARATLAAASQLLPSTLLILPQMPDTTFTLPLLQTTEIFAVACTQPFASTWKAIWTTDFRPSSDRWATIPDPLAMAKAVLLDLARASTQPGDPTTSPADAQIILRSHAWSTLSL